MPQAMEWSLATPMMRPRLPFIMPVVMSFPPVAMSANVTVEDECRVGAAEAERIRDHGVDLDIVDALENDRIVGEGRIDLIDMRRLGDEAVVDHQQAVDRLLHAGGAEGVSGQRLCRRDRGA